MVAIKRRRWWHNLYLEFYVDTFIVKFQTRLFREAIERMTYDVCRLRITIWKWKAFEFELYRRES